MGGKGVSKLLNMRNHQHLFEVILDRIDGLFKFLNTPQIPPTKSEAKRWGKNWQEVEKILADEDRPAVERSIEGRREQVREIQRGNGIQGIQQLGITLNRLNIGDIAIKSGTQLEKAAEKEISEIREREAEKVELEHVKKRVEELQGIGYTIQEARDIVQTERGKVNKNIQDIQGIDLKGLGQALGESLKRR